MVEYLDIRYAREVKVDSTKRLDLFTFRTELN